MLNEQVENVMAIAFELARIREEHGAQSGMYLSEVRALRAEVERLAAQAAPNLLDAFKSGNAILIDWPMEPVTPQEALKLMDMMDAEYTKTVGKSSPDREMAVCMQRVQHMACDLWASQKEVMRSHFVELVAAQPSQAPVVQAGEYPPLPQGKAVIRCVADTDEGGWVVDFDCEGPLSHEPQEGDELFTADQMHAYLDADRASSGATTAQAVRMLTPEEPEKCYSLDEETFYDLGDLIDMLDEEQAKPGILVYEGESVRHKASHYARGAVANLFERMGEQAFDDAGEHIGDWPDHAVKDDNSAEFEKLIYDWLDANVKVHFYTVKNVRQIALTADMLGDDNAGRTIPADGKIGGV